MTEEGFARGFGKPAAVSNAMNASTTAGLKCIGERSDQAVANTKLCVGAYLI